MTEYDNNELKKRNFAAKTNSLDENIQKPQPAGHNAQQKNAARPQPTTLSTHRQPGHSGQPEKASITRSPQNAGVSESRLPQAQPVIKQAPRQGGTAVNLPRKAGVPPRPAINSPYPGVTGSAQPRIRQPAASHPGSAAVQGHQSRPMPPPSAASATAATSTVAPVPTSRPVSPYAGAAVAYPAGSVQNPAPQSVSPYAGVNPASSGPAPGPAPSLQPPSPYAGAALAAPALKTAVSDEEKKRLEEEERTQKYSELTFLEKIAFSAALVWGYRTNFIFGAAAVVIFNWCLQHLIGKYFGTESDSIIIGLPVLFLSTFASLFVGVCFATVISHISDHGDPESTADLLFAPSNGSRFMQIAPALGIWALLFSGINLLIFSMGGSSSLIDTVVNVTIISCSVPITMCIIYYFADNDGFGVMEGVLGPLKIFTSNIAGWLFFIPICVFTIVAAVIILGVVLIMPSFGFVMLGLKLVLCLAVVMLTASYIFTYGCYVYKETAAKLKLAEMEE